MKTVQKKRIEKRWQSLKTEQTKCALQFDWNTYSTIVSVVEKGKPIVTAADAIMQQLGPELNKIKSNPQEKFISFEDAKDFLEGYMKLCKLLAVALVFVYHGKAKAEQSVTNVPNPVPELDEFARQYMNAASILLKKDPTGRLLMDTYSKKMIKSSGRHYFNEGVFTVRDTFVAYSLLVDEFLSPQSPDDTTLESKPKKHTQILSNATSTDPNKDDWSSWVGEKVIITVKQWCNSKDRETLERIASNLLPGQAVPDLIYRSKEKFEARLEAINQDRVDFFLLDERFFSYRSREDVLDIELATEREKQKSNIRVSDCVGKNVIITFVDWNASQCKKDYDLMFSYAKTITGAAKIPNFLFLRNGPSLIRIESIESDELLFFSYNDKIFYIRSTADVKDIKLFRGTKEDISEFLYNSEDRINNPPSFNPVFERDPSGSLGSLSERIRSTTLSATMMKLMVVNLCSKESAIFDSDFFAKVQSQKGPLISTSVKAIKSIYGIELYNLIMDRGILYRDIPRLNVFSEHRTAVPRTALSPKSTIKQQPPLTPPSRTQVKQTTAKPKERRPPTLIKAIIIHLLLLCFGVFYLDKKNPRRWLYPLSIFLMIILAVEILYEMGLGTSLKYTYWDGVLLKGYFIAGYVGGLVDIIFINKTRKSSKPLDLQRSVNAKRNRNLILYLILGLFAFKYILIFAGEIVNKYELSVIKQDGQGTVIDFRNLQTYKAVRVGNRLWMAQNLNYPLPNPFFFLGSTINRAYKLNTFCYDSGVYGRSFRWDAVNRASPIGWHLPSKEEWQWLLDSAKIRGGMSSLGFDIQLGGYYPLANGKLAGRFKQVGITASFWTSTSYEANSMIAYEVVISQDIGRIGLAYKNEVALSALSVIDLE